MRTRAELKIVNDDWLGSSTSESDPKSGYLIIDLKIIEALLINHIQRQLLLLVVDGSIYASSPLTG
jgi:hypothetical protein